jgi:hypothetical protein
MTGLEHSILATGLLALFYYFGRHVGQRQKVENIVEHTLDMLEANSFIKVKIDKNGDKELIPLDNK